MVGVTVSPQLTGEGVDPCGRNDAILPGEGRFGGDGI